MPRTIKRNDTYPPLTGTCSDGSGPVALSGADEVLLILKGSSVTLELELTELDDPGTGQWSYTWQAEDTEIAGDYAAEVQVTWSAGVVQTFPAGAADNDTVTMDEDLNP